MGINILFFLGEDPFPVNNGVTVAVAGLAQALSHQENVYIYNFTSNNFYKLGDEGTLILSGLDMFNINFGLVVCSPILSIKEYYFKYKSKISSRFVVGLINDNYTYVLWRNFVVSKQLGKLDFKDIKGLFKIPYVYVAESFLCSFTDAVLVQTPVEKRIFDRYFFNVPNVLVSPNGTQFSVDKHQISKYERSGVGLVASFNDSYMKVATWFIDEVWTVVVERNKEIKLHLLGKNTSMLVAYIYDKHPSITSSIIIEKYHKDISEFYLKRSVVVSPIFKNFGLINKTVEAMQCGCLVVGDDGAFNGLEDCEDGKHCLVANNSADFIESILKGFESCNEKIREAAFEYITEQLNWRKNANELLDFFKLESRGSDSDR